MHTLRKLALAACLAVAFAGPAQAGRTCTDAKPTLQSISRGMALAQRTAAALDASGAQVVVLARAGQDLSRYDLRWSHLGLAWRTVGGPWRVSHKLNQCGTATSALYRQGLGEFFLDDPWRYEAAWVVPTPELQQKLLAVLQSRERSLELHEPRYSMVSYAWGQQYQQSNQWALETMAEAMEPATIHRREQAQAWLRFKGYAPTVLRVGPLTRLGGRMTRANIAFDDHPTQDRFADRIATVTVDSVFAWMAASGLGGAPVRLELR
jgi:hypothetical protein